MGNMKDDALAAKATNCWAQKNERTEGRKDMQAISYDWHLQTNAGKVTLTVPKLTRCSLRRRSSSAIGDGSLRSKHAELAGIV